MLLGFKKFAPKLPGVLITVASLTWISYAIGYANLGGRVVGVVPQGLPTLSLPPLDWHATVALLAGQFCDCPDQLHGSHVELQGDRHQDPPALG